MGKVAARVFIIFVIVVLVTIGALFGLYSCSSNTPFESLRTDALNTAIDRMGIKEAIDANLRERAKEIADKYGLPSELTEGSVDMLAIDEWKVVNTPSDNAVRDHVDLHLEGSDLSITTYEDPYVISIESSGDINTFGQTITFSVPESAQGVTNVLALYDNTGEFGLSDLAGSFTE